MTRFFHRSPWLAGCLLVAACGAPPPPAAHAPAAVAPTAELSRLLDSYWNEHHPLPGVIESQALADELAIERRYLDALKAIPRDGLDADGKLNYDIFQRRRELAVEGFTYPEELLPLHPFHGLPLQLALIGLESGQRPWSSADYEDWLHRVDSYVSFAGHAVENMRDGVRRGYLTPRPVVERMVGLLERLGAEGDANVFYTPLHSLPESLNPKERTRLTKVLTDAVSGKILPATHRLHDFLKTEYLSKARAGLSLSDEPLGAAWYAYRLKRDIHHLGLAEVEKLKGRMQPATPAAALPVGELLSSYEELSMRVNSAIATAFPEEPSIPFEIQATDFTLEPDSPLSYWHGAAQGSRPGVLYVDTTEKPFKPAVASFLKYAVPGEHFLSSVARQSGLPKFRRFATDEAFIEGWGMYAASLGEQLGVLNDDASRQQWLEVQMRCAALLVLDTGIHAMGWTRAQALDYLHTQALLDDAEAEAMVDYVTSAPGDGAACMMGGQKFQSLRARAQQALGSRFDERVFHARILRDGSMPLDMLDATIKSWVETYR
jgi:uncharacterized protein (DUF885 family)